MDHFSYRSWCRHCVKGRGSGEQHRRGPPGDVPIISADYLIVTKRGTFTTADNIEKAEVILKILLVKDAKSEYIGAHVVPVTGVGEDPYAAKKMRRDMLWLGDSRVIVKTDNGPASNAMLHELLKALKVEVIEASADHAQRTRSTTKRSSLDSVPKASGNEEGTVAAVDFAGLSQTTSGDGQGKFSHQGEVSKPIQKSPSAKIGDELQMVMRTPLHVVASCSDSSCSLMDKSTVPKSELSTPTTKGRALPLGPIAACDYILSDLAVLGVPLTRGRRAGFCSASASRATK